MSTCCRETAFNKGIIVNARGKKQSHEHVCRETAFSKGIVVNAREWGSGALITHYLTAPTQPRPSSGNQRILELLSIVVELTVRFITTTPDNRITALHVIGVFFCR